jgi:hypothetical protein
LTRVGVFNSLDKLSTGGDRAMRQYYANHIGDDLARELLDA